jgi:CheY-like chemotaxis protein
MLKADKALILLIVDDNQQMRRLIKSVVGDLAEMVAECCDGALALAAYSESLPDWVLMDIKMQEMDGISATRQIRSSYPEAHVCIVTDYDDRELREAAREAGAEGYVIKEDLLKLRQVLAA